MPLRGYWYPNLFLLSLLLGNHEINSPLLHGLLPCAILPQAQSHRVKQSWTETFEIVSQNKWVVSGSLHDRQGKSNQRNLFKVFYQKAQVIEHDQAGMDLPYMWLLIFIVSLTRFRIT